MKIPELYGVILVGGHSTRMGEDKSLLTYHDNLTQREYVFTLLSKFCKNVYTSCRADQQIPDIYNPLPDTFPINGPLNGILSAFKKHADKAWLAIAIDMPYVNEDTLTLLVNERDIKKQATCFYNSAENFPEPLLTIWEPVAYEHLLKFVDEGNLSPRNFLKQAPIKMINPPDSSTLININYPTKQ